MASRKVCRLGASCASNAAARSIEGGDGLAGGAAEAGENEFPARAGQAVAAFEGVGEEFEGRLMAAGEDILEEGLRRGLTGLLGPERAFAVVGEGEEMRRRRGRRMGL